MQGTAKLSNGYRIAEAAQAGTLAASSAGVSKNASFELLLILIVCASSALSCLAPIAFSTLTVFLFAGPHNWVELRYFLSRLPSRLGPLKPFFLSSFTGVIFLGLSYAGLLLACRYASLEASSATVFFQFWILAFHSWFCLLVATKNKMAVARKICFLTLAAASILLSLQFPLHFGLALVYLHPALALVILDRELKRSAPGKLASYRKMLFLVPLILVAICATLCSSPSLPEQGELARQIERQAGSFLFPNLSTHLLVSAHTFLEMLHYAVWILAIPIFSKAISKGKWQTGSMPVTKNSKPLRLTVAALFAVSTVLTLALWAAFFNDCAATRELYFTVAVFHILAEIPFLLWVL